MAVVRPALPPMAIGLPVITPGSMRRTIVPYWSIIQPITSSLVATSGAGMSISGPMKSAIASM